MKGKIAAIIGIVVAVIAIIVVSLKKKPPPPPVACTKDTDCLTGYICKNGVCVVAVTPPVPPVGKCTPGDEKCEGSDLYECWADKQWHLFERNSLRCIAEAIYTCQYCGKVFATADERAAHIRLVHPQPLPYACPYCREKFAYAVELADHIASAHPYEPPIVAPPSWPVEYICPYCNAASKTMTWLFEHFAKSHGSLIPSGTATLLVDTEPVKAEISIGDTYLGKTPLKWEAGGMPYPLPFRMGWHRVDAYYEPRNLVFFMIPGVTTKVKAIYTPWGVPVPQLKPDATLIVKTEPVVGGVYLEGVWQSWAPQTFTISSQWVWTVQFGEVAGYVAPRPREIIAKPGETIEVIGTFTSPELPVPPPPVPPPPVPPIPSETHHYIHLNADWNRIIYDGKSGDIAILTSNIIGLTLVYYYEAGTGVGGWTIYNPAWAAKYPERNTLATLEFGKSYDIKVTTIQDWKVLNAS